MTSARLVPNSSLGKGVLATLVSHHSGRDLGGARRNSPTSGPSPSKFSRNRVKLRQNWAPSGRNQSKLVQTQVGFGRNPKLGGYRPKSAKVSAASTEFAPNLLSPHSKTKSMQRIGRRRPILGVGFGRMWADFDQVGPEFVGMHQGWPPDAHTQGVLVEFVRSTNEEPASASCGDVLANAAAVVGASQASGSVAPRRLCRAMSSVA